jgi:hypothetical protein
LNFRYPSGIQTGISEGHTPKRIGAANAKLHCHATGTSLAVTDTAEVTFGATATHCLIGRRRGHEYRDRRKLATDEMFQVIIVLASRKKVKPSRFLPN